MQRRRDLLMAALAFVTGAMDAIGFLGLGAFTSVMTGNMVLLGLGAGDRNGGMAVRASLALIGYIAGAGAGSLLTRRSAGVASAVWPRQVTVALGLELVTMVLFASGWELAGGRPAGTSQGSLLVVASLAMGVQSAAIRELRVPGLSTTYLTGTLTDLVGDVAQAGRSSTTIRRSLPILVALIVGAGAGGALVTEAPRVAPALPLAGLVAVIVVAGAWFDRAATAAGPDAPPRPGSST